MVVFFVKLNITIRQNSNNKISQHSTKSAIVYSILLLELVCSHFLTIETCKNYLQYDHK